MTWKTRSDFYPISAKHMFLAREVLCHLVDSALFFLSEYLIWNEFIVQSLELKSSYTVPCVWFTLSEHFNENKPNTEEVIMWYFVDPSFLFLFAPLERLKPGHLDE